MDGTDEFLYRFFFKWKKMSLKVVCLFGHNFCPNFYIATVNHVEIIRVLEIFVISLLKWQVYLTYQRPMDLRYKFKSAQFIKDPSTQVISSLTHLYFIQCSSFITHLVKGCGFEPHWRHCIVSLSKNINPSLVTGSTQEDLSLYN